VEAVLDWTQAQAPRFLLGFSLLLLGVGLVVSGLFPERRWLRRRRIPRSNGERTPP
jgi:hypothetical protein